ncbi:hypothetical protein ACNUDN_11935 [Mycobacterium sp. smrl_JER01]|uniref:hypothetical protein n=1 Tax=Mycobacterium sp. smrl_JER01 TaxID=3402633 RepID=UPI003ACC7E87
MELNSRSARARVFVAVNALITAATLNGCGAGQQSQTAVMQPAVNGSTADLNDIALRNIRIRAELSGYAAPPGRSADLALVVTNQSWVTADTLVAVTSAIGEVVLVGYTAIPEGGVLIIDSPDRTQADALATVKPVNAAAATVVLNEPISYAMSYTFTFEFAYAGGISVDVPVVSPDTDRPPTTSPVRR